MTLPPNSCVRFPNVIVCDAFDRKVIGDAKAHDAEVDASVQLPFETLQAPPADDTTYAAPPVMATFPLTATTEAFVLRTPVAPASVSPPAAVRA